MSLDIHDYEKTGQTVKKDDPAQKVLMETLARLGGDLVQEDALIYRGRQMILPETMAGNIDGAIRYLSDYQKQQEQEHRFNRTFNYRPNDGAHALQAALKKIFGSTGVGRYTHTFFSSTPPEFISVDVGVNEQAQVPWGQVSFPPLEATLFLTEKQDPTLGPLFHLLVDCPRKYRGHVEGLFIAIEQELRENSIYKGKAIDGATKPGFIDPFRTNKSRVVYSEDVTRQLDANIWALIEHTDAMRETGLPLKRTCLVEGPFGTGKSLAATLTAQKAIENGWTFVFCRPGVDDLETTMKTANLYAPAVVFFEDIDVVAERGDSDTVSRLLDLFDGITNKGSEIICVLTTNHVERIHKAMLRPGRLDSVIHIGALDDAGYERLIKANVPEAMLDPNTDYAQVSEAMTGFMPAFAKEASDRAMRYAISRTHGDTNIVLSTPDFVDAANGLRPQLDLMEGAGEGTKKPTLDGAFRDAVQNATHGSQFTDRDGDAIYSLTVADEERKEALYH